MSSKVCEDCNGTGRKPGTEFRCWTCVGNGLEPHYPDYSKHNACSVNWCCICSAPIVSTSAPRVCCCNWLMRRCTCSYCKVTTDIVDALISEEKKERKTEKTSGH